MTSVTKEDRPEHEQQQLLPIRADNGWKILLGRGLAVRSFRQVIAFGVTYIREA